MNSGSKELVGYDSECDEDDRNGNSGTETDDAQEEPWLQSSEELLQGWCAKSRAQAAQHEKAARAFRSRHNVWGLPAACLPVMLAPIAASIDRDSVWWFQYAEAALLAFTGMCSVMTNFYGFSSKIEKHSSSASKYINLAQDIELELSKPRKYRQDVDIFSLRCQMVYKSLTNDAPDI